MVSSTQSSLIVPFPSAPDNYYIFTTDAVDNAGIKGLRLSVVDMTLNAGLGAITIKNDSLYAPITEKLTSVKHSNGNDIWVISHEHDTTLFVPAYLITNAGVSASPVISNVGNMYLYSPGSIGQLKVSPDGSTIATAVFSNIPTAEVYRFDNTTGIVSNRITLALANTMCYGIEFSPDSKKVYCASDNARVYQVAEAVKALEGIGQEFATEMTAALDSAKNEAIEAVADSLQSH